METPRGSVMRLGVSICELRTFFLDIFGRRAVFHYHWGLVLNPGLSEAYLIHYNCSYRGDGSSFSKIGQLIFIIPF
uniref:Uncharacterized protein n=1 Tax=Amphimedon queenslandica TaxID=400682 RepID=A0A1X7TBS8_AMPQE